MLPPSLSVCLDSALLRLNLFSGRPWRLLVVTSAVVLLPTGGMAATWNWNVSSGNWDVAGNWNPASIPSALGTDVINLTNGTALLPATTTFNSGRNIGVLTIGSFNTLNLTAQATIPSGALA